MPQTPSVTYFTIKDAKSKISTLIEIAAKHISKKQPLNILVSDKVTQNFVSNLLWTYSEEGFLPHCLDQENPSFHLIRVHLPLPSYESIESIFNLTSQPLSTCLSLKQIYEYEDLSHPSKKNIFEKKFKIYQDTGFTLCST